MAKGRKSADSTNQAWFGAPQSTLATTRPEACPCAVCVHRPPTSVLAISQLTALPLPTPPPFKGGTPGPLTAGERTLRSGEIREHKTVKDL